MAMPPLSGESFIDSLCALVDIDRGWIPASAGMSLYLRPFMMATGSGLGAYPTSKYTYLLIGSPAGLYFRNGVKPVRVWLSTEYIRAAPGGTGEVKCAGNYGGSFAVQAQAVMRGCDQVVWLDALERRWAEEMGGGFLCTR